MLRRVLILLVGIVMTVSSSASAEIVREVVEYKEGDTVLEGVLFFDDSVEEKRPAVLVIHEWYGLNEYAESRAKQIAEKGLIAFAGNIYGKGVNASNNDEAAKLAGPFYRDRDLFRRRVNAGLNVLKGHDRVMDDKLMAIGYCFGGTAVLELARSGAEVAGVVSFHGGLGSPTPDDAKNIKGRVVAYHGGDDPLVPDEELLGFMNEMRGGKVDWEVVTFGGAEHGFTNPNNGPNEGKGVSYDKDADMRSWKMFWQFVGDTFGEQYGR